MRWLAVERAQTPIVSRRGMQDSAARGWMCAGGERMGKGRDWSLVSAMMVMPAICSAGLEKGEIEKEEMEGGKIAMMPDSLISSSARSG